MSFFLDRKTFNNPLKSNTFLISQTIEMIEKEQREAERRPITKITHKGEIEIESQEPVKATEPAEVRSTSNITVYLTVKCRVLNFFFFPSCQLEPPSKVTEVSAEPPKTPEKKSESTKMEKDTTNQHKSHLFDLHCKICTGTP